jgi:hypothetical protein
MVIAVHRQGQEEHYLTIPKTTKYVGNRVHIHKSTYGAKVSIVSIETKRPLLSNQYSGPLDYGHLISEWTLASQLHGEQIAVLQNVIPGTMTIRPDYRAPMIHALVELRRNNNQAGQ